MKTALNVLLPLFVAGYVVVSCATVKPVVRTVVDVARELCAIHFSEAQAISFEDAAETACKTEKQLRPFIDAILSAKAEAAAAVESAPAEPSAQASVAPAPAASSPATPAPSASVAP